MLETGSPRQAPPSPPRRSSDLSIRRGRSRESPPHELRARRPRLETGSPRRAPPAPPSAADRKSTRLNSSHEWISYAVFCLKKKKKKNTKTDKCITENRSSE